MRRANIDEGLVALEEVIYFAGDAVMKAEVADASMMRNAGAVEAKKVERLTRRRRTGKEWL